MSDADFDSLSNALDGCFDMPLAELPAELSARIAFPWDAIEPDQRRFAAYWWDCRHNPSNEEENNASSHVAWYDSTLNAATWWSLSRITPKEAAMLLCQFDPHDEKCAPLEITNDETGPIDYKILLRALEGVAEQDPTPRSLIDWLSVARTRRLKHHSWAERYERAVQVLKAADLKLHQEAIIAVPLASEVPEAAPEVSDSSGDHGEQEDRAQEGSADIGGRNFDVPDAFREAATTQAVAEPSEQPDMEREGQTTDTPSGAAMHQAPRNTVQANLGIGVSKKEIIAVFDPPNPRQTEKQWANMLGDPPEWLKPARVDSGGKGIQSLWNPAQLAILLAERGAMQRRPLGAIIRRHFREYLREWQDYAGTFD